MRLLPALIAFALSVTAIRAEETSGHGNRYFVGFGAGPQSGNGVHLGVRRGAEAVDLGLGLIYDGQDAKWGYSTGLRYLHTLYSGRVNDTYAWGGGAVTGNYSDRTAAHITSIGAGLGISLHFGLPIHAYFDSGLAAYFSEGFAKKAYYPAFNGGIVYEW